MAAKLSWFNERYDEFIYVDRIAVATEFRNQGIGLCYMRKCLNMPSHNIPVTAEVSLRAAKSRFRPFSFAPWLRSGWKIGPRRKGRYYVHQALCILR